MYNPQEIEKRWQKKWSEAKLFEADPISGIEKKFITVPYPYVSGPLHIGHGRSYINGDVFARYYRAKGYNVLFPMAFHITGTPILAISFGIKMNEKAAIDRMKDYISIYEQDQKKIGEIIRSFSNPWNVVSYFSAKIKEDFQSIGLSIDWRREFTTGDKYYNKFIEWQFYRLQEMGYIEKGKYPILFCPKCGNAVGEDDIQRGDELDLDIREYSAIKFPFREGFLVASTLRPETLFGITNIWINPLETYVKAFVDDEIWYISKNASSLLQNQAKKIKIIKEFTGSSLIGEQVKTLYNSHIIPILPGNFVDVSTATGVVYSVPAHAPYDYIALEDLKKNHDMIEKYDLTFKEIQNIEPIKIINMEGISRIPAKIFCEKYNIVSQKNTDMLEIATNEIYKKEFYNGLLNEKCGDFVGLEVQNALDKIKEDLSKKNLLDKIYYPVSKNLKCRCGAKVIVSILENQYFINYNASKWKESAFYCLNKMNILPQKYRLTFEKTFEWLDKRPCARRRGLGTNLPFNKEWIIESLSDSTIYMSFYTIIHLLKKNEISPEQLSKEFFDFVFLKKGESSYISQKIKIPENLLVHLQNEFSYWYPVDHRHTAIMHISNHLSFYIFHHVAIFPEKNWPKLISLIEPVIREGQKMGKSKGNVISLAEIQEKYSSDLFRFFICHAADFGVKVDWTEKRISSVRKHLNNFYKFLIDHSNLSISNYSPINKVSSKYSKVTISRVLNGFKTLDHAINHQNLREYLQIGFYEIFSLMQEYNKFYTHTDEYKIILDYIVPLWLERLNPAIPHLTEELWERFGGKAFLSNKRWTKLNESLIDEDLENEFKYIESVIEDISRIIRLIKVSKIKGIHLYISPEWKYEVKSLIDKYNDNFDKIKQNLTESLQEIEKKKLFPYIKELIKSRGWIDDFGVSDEIKALKDYKHYIEKKVGNQIIVDSHFDPFGKSDKAIPGKPAIYVED